MNNIFRQVREFYTHFPYPSQKINSIKDLFNKKHSKIMNQILFCAGLKNTQLRGLKVLDAGCGTGEKALYLAALGAKVDAFDISPTSIKIAKKTSKKLNLKVNFFVNSFEHFNTTKKYDLILAIGSLHHSSNPKKNFLNLLKFLKPNGVIVLGLYHLYGRFFHRLKRFFLHLIFKNKFALVNFLSKIFKIKSKAGLMLLADKYASPFESYQTLDDVLEWFKSGSAKAYKSYPIIDFNSNLNKLKIELIWFLKQKSFFFISAKKD
jgi:2-polyprenyl-3-methyl-5-hydroxy-6-metoxy-1,4-benzoquinol methylase